MIDDSKVVFDGERFATLCSLLQRAASGESSIRQPLTGNRDELDAVAYAINALTGELNYRAQQAEDANRSKTQFLRHISHELRTPLTAILAAADLLNREGVSSRQREEFVRTIQANGQSLLRLISDLIDLSKAETGQFKPEVKSMRVQEWIGDVIDSLRPAAVRKNLSFRFEMSNAVPEEINCCAQSLRQILVNLIGNAIKFTSRGEVFVYLSYESDPSMGPCLLADVKDSGIGIEQKVQEQLFQPFVQGCENIAKKFGGSGIGLALSQRLAQALGGHLRLLKSEVGKGSIFQMKVPCCATKAHQPQPRLAGTHILLAEDNQEIRELFETILTIEGAHVTSVADGSQALEKAASHHYDIVLLDVNMPNVSGVEAVHELRQRGFTLPVLAVTADEICDQPLTILNLGFDDSISKPFMVDSVCNKIVRHCQLSTPQPADHQGL